MPAADEADAPRVADDPSVAYRTTVRSFRLGPCRGHEVSVDGLFADEPSTGDLAIDRHRRCGSLTRVREHGLWEGR